MKALLGRKRLASSQTDIGEQYSDNRRELIFFLFPLYTLEIWGAGILYHGKLVMCMFQDTARIHAL
jgi:hypothetical protein